jgi:hypothetical protein
VDPRQTEIDKAHVREQLRAMGVRESALEREYGT